LWAADGVQNAAVNGFDLDFLGGFRKILAGDLVDVG
jgi:hypothetical protein